MNNTSGVLNITKTVESQGSANILIVFLDCLILILSLTGNSMVVYSVLKERKLQTKCNYLILNLSVCDIIVVTMGTSIDIMLQFTGAKWVLGPILCRALSPMLTMFYISGSLIMVVISIDRYQMFVHPFTVRYQKKHVKYSVIAAHIISFASVIPFAVFSTITDGHCYDVWPHIWYRKSYTIFLFLMQYALPLLMMAVAYTGVGISLMNNKSAFKKRSNRPISPPLAAKQTNVVEQEGNPERPGTELNKIKDGKVKRGKCFGFNRNKLMLRFKRPGSHTTQLLNMNEILPATAAVTSPAAGVAATQPESVKLTRRNGVRRQRAFLRVRDSNSTMRDKRNNRALKMVIIVVLVFAFFLLPVQIMSLVLDFGSQPSPQRYKIYVWFVMFSYFGSCTLNPFIYGLVDRTFRASFKKIAKKVTTLCTSS